MVRNRAKVTEPSTVSDIYNGRSTKLSASEEDYTRLAIFAVLCWTSLILDPDFGLNRTITSTGKSDHNLDFHGEGIIKTEELSQGCL